MARYSIAQKKRISEKLCIDCGTSILGNILFCASCANKRKQKSKTIRLNRRANNLCAYCSKPLEINEKRACEKCRKRVLASAKKLRDLRKAKGLCPTCGKSAIVGLLCEDCWFKKIAKDSLGSPKIWMDIKQLLQKQQYRCIYTNKKLVIGKNASLDHIIPKSKDGNNSIKNLQWVDLQINVIKNNNTHDEFIALCKLISNSF